ncbi:pentapeptide repeat-containing protein [Nocardia asteroides]|uniref:pentapeptide repeat-containing protein n=1 Tax=Nocardia asteroides TaxID=1824 RepID=UPI001E33C2E7|nr:pentapeptide repeat-containing protein [Nocardia asteroides]UGT62852.1 pentapeptide repeat-containing protein [Nocardia asteroides]
MRHLVAWLALAIGLAMMAVPAEAQVNTLPTTPSSAAPTTTSVPSPPPGPSAPPVVGTPPASTGWLNQPRATVIAGCLAVLTALVALGGVQLTRVQSARQHADTHGLEQIRALRERYTVCAEQLAHKKPAVRMAGVYALEALADDWQRLNPVAEISEDGGERLNDDARVCLDLLCAYMRSSAGKADAEVRRSIVSVFRRHARRKFDYKHDLTGADLQCAYLYEAYLRDARLDGANLRGADMEDIDLRRASLNDADLREVNLSSADLFGVYMQDADLAEADLANSEMRAARMMGANLRGANLYQTNLHSAHLQNAILVDTMLEGTDLGNADLRNAEMDGATYNRLTDWPEGFQPPSTLRLVNLPGEPISPS